MKIIINNPIFNHDEDGTTEAELWGNIELHGIKKDIYGNDYAYKEKCDTYDEDLGQLLSYVRALKDWSNHAENWLIQQSCIGAKSKTTLGDLTVNLKLNTEEFKKEWKEASKLINDMDRHFSSSGRWEDRPVKNAKLKSLVGKWAIRTKPAKFRDGHEDDSYMKTPLYIIEVVDNYMKCNSSQYGFRELPERVEPLVRDTSFVAEFNVKDEWEAPFLDNNWKEYKQ